MSTHDATGRRVQHWVVLGLAVVILVPSLWGFANKFSEFIATFSSDPDGAFAVVPIVNYLLASVGFLLLLAWAVLHGMFRDVEAPKYTMLENERRLDATEREEPCKTAEGEP